MLHKRAQTIKINFFNTGQMVRKKLPKFHLANEEKHIRRTNKEYSQINSQSDLIHSSTN